VLIARAVFLLERGQTDRQTSKQTRLNAIPTLAWVMILGSNPPASSCVSENIINTVKCFELLGINISEDLRWESHIDVVHLQKSRPDYIS